jgi:hypothetical protein
MTDCRRVERVDRNVTVKSSTHKKVIVRKMDRDAMQGYVAPASFVVGGKLELMNTAGKVVLIELADVKGVYFVRDFADVDGSLRKTFATRPRTEGLWVRMKFKDNDVMEGLMPNDLTQVTSEGFLVSPPDSRGNLQRIFVPRSALAELAVLGVIGGPVSRRKRPRAAPVVDSRQVPMFTE